MNYTRYIIVFGITIVLFVGAFVLSDQISNKKVDQLREIQSRIALEILSTETRYSLLGASSCSHIISNETFDQGLNQELSDLARRVKFIESERGSKDEAVAELKKQYNLLQIKDYILRNEIAERCGGSVASLLYFHESDCKDCQKESIILDELHALYPELRIYWFDRDLETPAMETLVSMFKISGTPSIVLEGELFSGMTDQATLEAALPQWLKDEAKKREALEASLKAVESETPAASTSIEEN